MFSTKIWTNYVKLQRIFINIGAKKYEFDNVESCRNIVDICENSSINFCKNAAIELGEFKIRVNAISPGTINTPLLATAIEDSKLEQPIKDFGMPIDIAYSALFLASDESRFITGINLCVDGGLTLDNSGLMVDAAEHYAKMGIERVVGMNMGSTGIESVITDLQDDD